MKNQLEQLKQYSVVVADTGDLESIRTFQPHDATTNPSLVLKAVKSGQFNTQIKQILALENAQGSALDRIAVTVGHEILSLVPGYISTEVDAQLSFNYEKTLLKARQIIQLYQQQGWQKERILIKIAATWEGIQAAKTLEQEGIHCNLTLIFNLTQAIACAQAKVTLISPFVGRILDWHQANSPQAFTTQTDPGVLSVKNIYQHFKQHNYDTIIMGASFRNKDQVLALAGCDRLTISPALLDELQQSNEPISAQLTHSDSTNTDDTLIDEETFRLNLCLDAMATEKLNQGIRNFIADQKTLEAIVNDLR